MSLVQGKGSEIDFAPEVDLKKVFIRLKDGEDIPVRVLSINDYVEYKAHGSFEHKIYTQACVAPLGEDCPLCRAAKSGIEGFDALYPKKRYLFAFVDLTDGTTRVWDCSKNQAKDMLSQIKEYEDSLDEVAFKLKRTGNKTDTSYKLNPILKMKGAIADKFHEFDDADEVPVDFFEAVLKPRSTNFMKTILQEAGFPVLKFYPDFVPDNPTESTGTSESEGAPAPTDDDIPF